MTHLNSFQTIITMISLSQSQCWLLCQVVPAIFQSQFVFSLTMSPFYSVLMFAPLFIKRFCRF